MFFNRKTTGKTACDRNSDTHYDRISYIYIGTGKNIVIKFWKKEKLAQYFLLYVRYTYQKEMIWGCVDYERS